MAKTGKDEITSTLSVIPSSLSESDIKDMFYIADQHFQSKTPSSVHVRPYSALHHFDIEL